MDKKTLKELKEKLEKEKITIEKQLKSFAKKDKKIKGDWDTLFPKWDGDSGSSALERAADQVEEYGNLLSLEYNLENWLKNINLALEKIQKAAKGEPRQGRGKYGKYKNCEYGKCEDCGKEIKKERLKIFPAARFCLKCEKK